MKDILYLFYTGFSIIKTGLLPTAMAVVVLYGLYLKLKSNYLLVMSVTIVSAMFAGWYLFNTSPTPLEIPFTILFVGMEAVTCLVLLMVSVCWVSVQNS